MSDQACNQEALNNYVANLQSEEWKSFREAGGELYHYTTLLGLQGILKTKTVWLNPYHNLSDDNEIKHALDIILGMLVNYVTKENYEMILRKIHELFSKVGYISAFTSFADSPDLDNMWNDYADQCAGVVIQFNQKLIFDSRSDFNCTFGKVKYGNKVCENVLEAMLEKLNCVGVKRNRALDVKCFLQLLSAVFPMLPFYKREKFSREREHRIVYAALLLEDGKDYNFIPYEFPSKRIILPGGSGNDMNYKIAYPFSYNAINRIILRDCKKRNELERNIKMLLYSGVNGYSEKIDQIEVINYYDI